MNSMLSRISATLLALAFASPAAAETLLERGTYLVRGVVACGNCHTPQGPNGPIAELEFAGQLIDKSEMMTAYAPNITPHPTAGIGKWTDDQLVKAIREGVRPDGTLIGPPMPFHWYRMISDRDAKAIVAYLRQVRPSANTTPKSDYRFPLPPAWGPPPGKVAEVDAGDRAAYGKYLTAIGHCLECHTPMGKNGRQDYENRTGAGGFVFKGPWGVSISANITPHGDGIGEFSEAQVKTMIAKGVRPDGSRMKPPMGYAYYSHITDADLDALIGYLRTLPPKADK